MSALAFLSKLWYKIISYVWGFSKQERAAWGGCRGKRCSLSMNVHESGEMYLDAILVLSRQSGYVRSIDVGEYLGYSKPSVSRAMGLLRKGGLITVEKDGALLLTDAGRAIAEKIYERHTVLSKVLIRLGVPEKIAVEDACKIEHDISDETFQLIKKHIAAYEESRK